MSLDATAIDKITELHAPEPVFDSRLPNYVFIEESGTWKLQDLPTPARVISYGRIKDIAAAATDDILFASVSGCYYQDSTAPEILHEMPLGLTPEFAFLCNANFNTRHSPRDFWNILRRKFHYCLPADFIEQFKNLEIKVDNTGTATIGAANASLRSKQSKETTVGGKITPENFTMNVNVYDSPDCKPVPVRVAFDADPDKDGFSIEVLAGDILKAKYAALEQILDLVRDVNLNIVYGLPRLVR